jgi:hypothetical protein
VNQYPEIRNFQPTCVDIKRFPSPSMRDPLRSHENRSTAPFVGICHVTNEEDVLFDMHRLFRVDRGKAAEDQRSSEALLTLTAHDDVHLRQLTETMDEQVKDFTGWARIGELALKSGQGNVLYLLISRLFKPCSVRSRMHTRNCRTHCSPAPTKHKNFMQI